MKFSTTMLKKINGDPIISSSIINNEDVTNIVSGIVQNQLSGQISDQIINEVDIQIQNNVEQLSGDWVTRNMLTFQ